MDDSWRWRLRGVRLSVMDDWSSEKYFSFGPSADGGRKGVGRPEMYGGY